MHGEISTEFSFANVTGIRQVIQQMTGKISTAHFQVEVSLKIHSKNPSVIVSTLVQKSIIQ